MFNPLDELRGGPVADPLDWMGEELREECADFDRRLCAFDAMCRAALNRDDAAWERAKNDFHRIAAKRSAA